MIDERKPLRLVIQIAALVGVLSLLQSGLAQAGSPQICPTAVQLEGEAALTAAIAQALRRHGIITQPPADCPRSFVRITKDARGLVVSSHQPLAQAERVVSDPAVAAALIDSWLRSDLTDSLLAAPDLMEPPLPPPPPPPVAPRPRPHFTVSLLFEGVIDKDAARWLGGSLHGCAPVGPLCLGAIVRTAADVPAVGVGAYLDQRLAVDVLASVIWPLRRGRWIVAPGLGLGAGWLHHNATSVTAKIQSEAEDDDVITATPIAASDGGLRAEVRLFVMRRLRDGWLLTSNLAFETAFLDGPTVQLPTGESLLGTPWAMLRGGLGLAWSTP